MENKSNGKSVAALVLGILALVGAFIPVVDYFTTVLAILAVIFGALGMKESKKTNSGHGMAVAGLVLGIIGLVLNLFAVIVIFGALGLIIGLL